MRITRSIVIRNLLEQVNRKTENLNTLQEAIATGQEVRKASDDPVRFSRAARYRNAFNQNEQFIRNINSSEAWVQASASVMEQMQDLLVDAKNIAQKAADSTYSDEARRDLAVQVNGMLEEMVSMANSRHINRNLFGGTMTKDGQPFQRDGTGAVVYSGNEETLSRTIGEGLDVDINITGGQLIGTGVFASIENLHAALMNNDIPAINATIDEIGAANEELLALSSTNGSLRRNLDMTRSRLEAANTDLEIFFTEEEGVDLAEAVVKFQSEQDAYQAALQSSSKILNLNILNYLR